MSVERLAGWLIFSMFALFGIGLLFAKVKERHHSLMKRLKFEWRGLPIDKSQGLRYFVAIASLLIAGVVYVTFLSGAAT